MLVNFGVGVGFLREEFSAFNQTASVNQLHFKELKKYIPYVSVSLDNM